MRSTVEIFREASREFWNMEKKKDFMTHARALFLGRENEGEKREKARNSPRQAERTKGERRKK